MSTDGGATWRLAAVQAPGGGPAPLGHAASRLAGGPGGWLAVGPQAIWTSHDGLTWTLAATHGVPQLPGDNLLVLTSTAHGFLVVKGSDNGFVVTGTTTAGQNVAYSSSGTGTTWQPTGSLGEAAAESLESATVGRKAPSSRSARPQAARPASSRSS